MKATQSSISASENFAFFASFRVFGGPQNIPVRRLAPVVLTRRPTPSPEHSRELVAAALGIQRIILRYLTNGRRIVV